MTTSDIQLEWDLGTAYDFIVSLSVLHDPEKFGLRGSWAAGVRSRLPASERELLQQLKDILWPFHWVYRLPAPKDGATFLRELAALPPGERLPALDLGEFVPGKVSDLLCNVGERGAWDERDLQMLVGLMHEHGWDKKQAAAIKQAATNTLTLWADRDGTGEGILSALTIFYDEFYAEEEARILPSLQAALARAQELAQSLALPDLLEELSQGVRLDDKLKMKELVLVPSFWATPLMLFAHIGGDKELFMFGARPADMSLIPGEVVPEVLFQALRAMADPTRLRILRYLSTKPSTPAELARWLRLRSPTVIHHLDALRLARLVQVTLDHEGRRYALRQDAIDGVCAMLREYVSKEVTDRE